MSTRMQLDVDVTGGSYADCEARALAIGALFFGVSDAVEDLYLWARTAQAGDVITATGAAGEVLVESVSFVAGFRIALRTEHD